MPSSRATVSGNGRLSLPADLRRKMGLEKGGVVQLDLVDGHLQVRSVRQAVAAIQRRVRAAGWHEKISVDEFIAEKRKVAARDSRKIDEMAKK